MVLDAAEIDWILTCEKRVTAKVSWSLQPGRTPKWETKFTVLVPDRHDPHEYSVGRVEGVTHQFGTKFAFVYGNVCLARWEDHGSHRNPDRKRIEGQHKHLWDEVHEDRTAYAPDDIDQSNRDSMLFSFLSELNVQFEGEYGPELPGLGDPP